VWGPPGQAALPGWAGAACHRPGTGLPGAAQRAPCCSRSPPALALERQPGCATQQRARAAPSSSSSCCCCCCSLLLQRKREGEPVNGDRQASAPAACPALPWLQHGAERLAGWAWSRQLEPRRRLSASGSQAPESQWYSGTARPSPWPALLHALGSSTGSVSTQNHLQLPLPTAWPCSSSSRPPLRCTTCMATLKGQVSTAQPLAPACLACQNSPAEGHRPPPLPDGTEGAPCWGFACKSQTKLRDLPRSTKAHPQADTRRQQPQRDTPAALSLPCLSAQHSSFPPTTASQDVPLFPLAPQHSLLPSCQQETLHPSIPPSLHTSLPLALPSSRHSTHSPGTPPQTEASERQPCSPLPGPPAVSPGSRHSMASTGQETTSARR